MRLKVLQVIDSLGDGGAERSLAALAGPLIARGVDLQVAYLREREGVRPALEAAGVRPFPLTAGSRLSAARAVRDAIRATEPDLVHTTLFEADVTGRIAARWAGVPVVSSLVNTAYGPAHLGDPGLSRLRVRSAQAVDAMTAQVVRRFHAISETVAETMAARLRIRAERITVIHRGRSSEVLGRRSSERSAAVRARFGLTPTTALVVAASRHEFQKGLDVLVRAFADVAVSLPGSRLVIAGRRGHATAELEGLIRTLSLQDAVVLLGRRDDVPDLLSAADVFVLPSRWEGFGSVLVEAMALEAPIVASDLPAVREVLPGDGFASLVPPGDPAALHGALVAALRDAGSARTARARARFLERFEIGPIADASVAFYERAVGPADGLR